MARYFLELRTGNYVKGYGFLRFGRNPSSKYGKQLLDTDTKTVLDALKPALKKIVCKTAEASEEFVGNKIADKSVKKTCAWCEFEKYWRNN